LLRVFFDAGDWGSAFVWDVGKLLKFIWHHMPKKSWDCCYESCTCHIDCIAIGRQYIVNWKGYAEKRSWTNLRTGSWLLILHVVLYGHETWSLTLGKEHRLRMFLNRVLRRMFGPKRDEVMWGWRKLYNEELRDLYSSPSIIRIIKSMRWVVHVARLREKRNV
jgi:hypothetical protein